LFRSYVARDKVSESGLSLLAEISAAIGVEIAGFDFR